MEYFLNTCSWKRNWSFLFFRLSTHSHLRRLMTDLSQLLESTGKFVTFWRGNIKSSNHKSKSGPHEKYLKIKFFLREKQRGWGRTLRGEALNTAVFPDKLSGAWGGFGADRRSWSSLPRPPGGADWINSSLRASRSLRGHRGNAGWGGKMEGALTGSHRTAACLYTLLRLHKYCTICCTTEMIPPVASVFSFQTKKQQHSLYFLKGYLRCLCLENKLQIFSQIGPK